MPAWLRSTVAKSFLWLLTTLGAAALGGLATSYIDRPTPAAAITGIHISEKYNDLFGKNQIVQIQLNSSLFRHINQSVWTPRFEKQSINLTNIIKILSDDLDNIDRLVEDLNNFEHALPDLRNLLYSTPNRVAAETFFENWEPLDGFIDEAIMGDIVRGIFFSPPKPPIC